MTIFGDNVYTGNQAATSALASLCPAGFTKTYRFTGGGNQAFSGVLPIGTQNLDAKLYIMQQGSAATTDKIVVSAGGAPMITFTSFGSALGIVRQTTTALGTLTVVASALANLSTSAETTFNITLSSVDTATDYQVQFMFNRADTN